MEPKNIPENLVFYDGDCGFCNSSVQFILSKKKKPFYFIPLQAERTRDLLNPFEITINLDTIYFLSEGKLYDRSSAALRIAKGLKGLYPLLFAFYIVPKFIRDAIYNFIARRRHKLRAGYCMIPKPEDEKYFIS